MHGLDIEVTRSPRVVAAQRKSDSDLPAEDVPPPPQKSQRHSRVPTLLHTNTPRRVRELQNVPPQEYWKSLRAVDGDIAEASSLGLAGSPDTAGLSAAPSVRGKLLPLTCALASGPQYAEGAPFLTAAAPLSPTAAPLPLLQRGIAPPQASHCSFGWLAIDVGDRRRDRRVIASWAVLEAMRTYTQ